ncbi:AmmeMemoRadiSam system protein B [Candidatus Woesearchaeota archaeon]|nr:AmmeMemoRadiSam system protein B [Candidatus Woesearchaeota archaeon]
MPQSISSMIRKPIVAGQFYEADFELLEKQLQRCFSHRKGAGGLPVKKRDRQVVAAVAPHAGYPFSGPCASWVYKAVGETKLPDVYVMLGVSHNGLPSAISIQDWQTPFGTVQTDKEFARAVEQNSNLKVDERPHRMEHSIEVQLPFLQFVNRDYLQNLRICPIIISEDIPFDEAARGIVKASKMTGKRILVIASSDFTHYGVSYGYTPFADNVKEKLYGLDKGAAELIAKLDAYRFLEYVDDKGATICGKHPVAAAVECAKLLGAKKGRLLQYYTSADLMGDYATAVGYAGIVFEKTADVKGEQ